MAASSLDASDAPLSPGLPRLPVIDQARCKDPRSSVGECANAACSFAERGSRATTLPQHPPRQHPVARTAVLVTANTYRTDVKTEIGDGARSVRLYATSRLPAETLNASAQISARRPPHRPQPNQSDAAIRQHCHWPRVWSWSTPPVSRSSRHAHMGTGHAPHARPACCDSETRSAQDSPRFRLLLPSNMQYMMQGHPTAS